MTKDNVTGDVVKPLTAAHASHPREVLQKYVDMLKMFIMVFKLKKYSIQLLMTQLVMILGKPSRIDDRSFRVQTYQLTHKRSNDRIVVLY